MISCLLHPVRERFLSKAVLALNLVLWLFWMPVMLRIHTIPMLLKRLARGEKHVSKMPMELKDAVGIVTRICNLRPFCSRFFPKQCLRRSLTLYRTLTRIGHPVEIHFGVLKDEKNFTGHSWVTIAGQPVADTTRSARFKVVYSYSSPHPILVSSDRPEIERSENEPIFHEA
jgi:hypothetical protein